MALLTAEQWRKVDGAFSWMKVNVEFAAIHVTIIQKWMERHCSGWWYYESEMKGKTLVVFEDANEMVMFRIWMTDNPFDDDHGQVP